MTWTTDLVDGVAQLLAVSGVVAYRPDSPYEPDETALAIDRVPDAPDRLVVLTSYPVASDPRASDVTLGLQVRCRSAAGDPMGDVGVSDRIYDLLHGLRRVALGGVWVVQSSWHNGARLGRDASGRPESTNSYYLQAVRPGPHAEDG